MQNHASILTTVLFYSSKKYESSIGKMRQTEEVREAGLETVRERERNSGMVGAHSLTLIHTKSQQSLSHSGLTWNSLLF